MSYNPDRQRAGTRLSQKVRRLDPRAGVKVSDIIKQRGPQAATLNDIQHKQNTLRGWKVVIHEGDQFEMVYEYICARNASGLIRHNSLDRALRVLAGELYITVGDEVAVLKSGDSYSLPAKLEYQFGTSGSFDTEVMFCQGPKYEDTLEQLVDSEATNADLLLKLPNEVAPQQTSFDPISRAKAQQHADKLAYDRHRREIIRRQAASGKSTADLNSETVSSGSEVVKAPTSGRKAPLAGQQVVGVNPRPIGAGGYTDQ